MKVGSLGRIASPHLGVVSVVLMVAAFGYGRLLAQQGDLPAMDTRQAFVLAVLVVLAALSAVGTFIRSATLRAPIAAACAGALLPLGVLALFSIGLVLVVAGLLAVIAWVDATRSVRRRDVVGPSVAAAMAAIVILAAGFAAT